MYTYKYLIIVIFLINLTYSANAQSPRVSIQGTLKDSKGAAAADGNYQVTFKLYTTPTLGTPIWSENAQIDIAGGIYSHYLGSNTPLNSADFTNTLFLGVQVGSIELSPRSELTYAPYAFAVQEEICSGAVGDVKYSILNPAQFATVNGPCWVPMDGRSIAGSKLKDIMGTNTVPDGSGVFLRIQEYALGADNDPGRTSASPIGVLQSSDVKPHGHSVSESAHTHSYNDRRHVVVDAYTYAGIGTGSADCADDSTTDVSETTNSAFMGASVNNNGVTETRPKNLNFWIYVRIN